MKHAGGLPRHILPSGMFARGHFCYAAPVAYFAGRPTSDAGENEKTAQHVPRGTFAENHEAERFSACRPDSGAGKLPACPGHGRKAVPNDMCRHLMAHSDQMHSRPQAFYDTLPPREPPAQKSGMFHVKPFSRKPGAGFHTEQFKGLFTKREGEFPAFP